MVVKLKLIVAASENLGIGKNGELPWKLKKEMTYFRNMTTNTHNHHRKNVVIMGRKTWESIPSKFRPLPNRINFVLSRSGLLLDDYNDTFVFGSLQQAFNKLNESAFQDIYEDVWIIGGASLYKEALESPNFHRLYLTKIHKQIDCDTFLPIQDKNLKEISDPEVPQDIQEEENLQYTYHVYEKS